MPTEEPESIVDTDTSADADQTAAPQYQDKDRVLEEALEYFIETNPVKETSRLSRGGDAAIWVSRIALLVSAMAMGIVVGREAHNMEKEDLAAKVSFMAEDYRNHPVYLEYLDQHEQLFEMSNDLIARLNNINAESLSRFELEELDNYSEGIATMIKEVSDKHESLDSYYREIMMAASPTLATAIQRTHGQAKSLRKEFRIGALNFFDSLAAAYDSFITIVDDTNFDREVLEEEGVSILFISDERSAECRIATQMIAHFDQNNSAGAKALKIVANGKNERFFEILEKEKIEIGVPSYVIFRNGKIVAHETGDLDAESLNVLILEALNDRKGEGRNKNGHKKVEKPSLPNIPVIPKPPKARTIFI